LSNFSDHIGIMTILQIFFPKDGSSIKIWFANRVVEYFPNIANFTKGTFILKILYKRTLKLVVWTAALELKILNVRVRNYLLNTKLLEKKESGLFYEEICWQKHNKLKLSTILYSIEYNVVDNDTYSDLALLPIQVPRAKLKFEVLFISP
jgi:hypothetical protein